MTIFASAMKQLAALLSLLTLLDCVACSESTSVDPDAIVKEEKSAVQSALNGALASDTLYPTLALLVFPYIDRASRLAVGAGDTLRLVGVQLDIDAAKGSVPVVARLSAILAWRGYRPSTRTVDTVTFIVGEGLTPPVNDSLRTRFSTDTAGTGTGFVIHQAADSSLQVWLARAGALHITSHSYGSGLSRTSGGVTLTTSRGTLAGDYHVTAKLVPDSSTAVTTMATFSTGIQALKVVITGALP